MAVKIFLPTQSGAFRRQVASRYGLNIAEFDFAAALILRWAGRRC